VSQHPGPNHATEVEERLLALLDGAATESFDPNPHADCRMCAFKPICPMWPQGEELLAPAHPPTGLDVPGAVSAGTPGRRGRAGEPDAPGVLAVDPRRAGRGDASAGDLAARNGGGGQ
jgi:hypothetical protein